MDFSEQLAEQRDIENTKNNEGVGMLQDVENEEKLDAEKIQNDKFEAAFDGADFNNTGPPVDDYNYFEEFGGGNTFTPDEEGGINLSNKNIKPATREIAGHDMATGERYTSEYESPLITQAINELQESKVNTKVGSPPEDMLPLSKIARGMNDQGATYEDFVRKTQGSWSDQQRATAWEGMVKAKQTLTDVKERGKRHFQEAKTINYKRADGIKQDIDETELVSSPVWIQSGKAVIDYFNPNGSDGMDEQEIHDFNLSLMSNFNYNIPMMMFYTNEIVNSEDPELAKSFLFLMDQNDATDISLDSVGRAFGGIGGDITSYLTAGGSVLVSRLAGASMKAGIRQALTKIAAVTAADAAVGGVVGAGTDVAGQEVEMAAGEREELDVGQAVKAGAISAALTATIGVGVATIADPALHKFGVGAVKGAIDKINPPAKAPIINSPIGPEQPPLKGVAFKSALRTEVGTLFEGTKKPKMKVSRLMNEIKGMVNNGKVKAEEVDWAGLKDLDSKSTVGRAEIDAILKDRIPVPSLDKTVSNSFPDMSFGGNNYREYVINVDKVGEYGGPEDHFGGKALEKGGEVGDQANVGHLRMEDVEYNNEVGTMFLEGQSDIRKVDRSKTYGDTKIAKGIRESKDTKVLNEAIKVYKKAESNYDSYVLEIGKKYDLDPSSPNYQLDMMAFMDEEETRSAIKLMQAESATRGRMISARQAIDNTRNKLNGEPFTPYRGKKSSNSLLFRSAVMEAMNSESKFLAWPKTIEQIGAIEQWSQYGPEFMESSSAKGASEFMVKDMKNLAEKHGFRVEEFKTPFANKKLDPVELDEKLNEWAYDNNIFIEVLHGENDNKSYIMQNLNTDPPIETKYSAKELAEFTEEFQVESWKDNNMYRIKFTPEQRREWGEKGAAAYSWGGAAILGGAAVEQKRDKDGKFM